MASRHLIDNHLNFARMWAEAKQDSIIDNFDRSVIQPGYFLIRLSWKNWPVAAKIYWRDFEPGNPENKLDRGPPVLAGEILGEYRDPVLVWTGLDRQPLTPPNDGLAWTIEGYYRYLCDDAKHARAHRPEEPIANPRRPVDLTTRPPIPPPGRKS